MAITVRRRLAYPVLGILNCVIATDVLLVKVHSRTSGAELLDASQKPRATVASGTHKHASGSGVDFATRIKVHFSGAKHVVWQRAEAALLLFEALFETVAPRADL